MPIHGNLKLSFPKLFSHQSSLEVRRGGDLAPVPTLKLSDTIPAEFLAGPPSIHSIDPKELVFSNIVNQWAPNNSAFRRYLRGEISRFIRNERMPHIDKMLHSFLIALERRAEMLVNNPDRLKLEPNRYGWLLPKLLGFLIDCKSKGLISFSDKQDRLALKVEVILSDPSYWRDKCPSPTNLEVDKAWHHLLTVQSIHSSQPEIYKKLESVLNGVFLNQDLPKMKIAVVGYGMNLDMILFFLNLGFEVAAIEKKDASQGWREVSEALDESLHLRFCQAIGLPEASTVSTAWPRLSHDHLHELLGRPHHLHFFDACDPDILRGQFDLVVVPAIIDEALETIISITRRGGYILADHYMHPQFVSTRDGSTFFSSSSEETRGFHSHLVLMKVFLLWSQYYRVYYSGRHQVYVLKRV